ncbi:hypothetical protein ES332_A12G148500v1 [Gossypium tomentosum]|uniref:Hydrophobic seed protein domain-containing protein n=1 Tax=Gossypium tomentosum TaxID=34277 RepID=A0A5D2MWW2_GOSTO|nr:hypothetical protein ES332_A12G148500v1 [Gossypium tomentosum]
MASIYPMQLLLVIAGFILRLAIPLAASSSITTTSSQGEIKCDTCTPVVLPPPPPSPPKVIECPPPPAPPSYPPPLPPAPRCVLHVLHATYALHRAPDALHHRAMYVRFHQLQDLLLHSL